jgi:hypothetical protein
MFLDGVFLKKQYISGNRSWAIEIQSLRDCNKSNSDKASIFICMKLKKNLDNWLANAEVICIKRSFYLFKLTELKRTVKF